MHTQRGATLAISLMLLLIITILGVSAMKMTHLEEKMSSNVQSKLLSFNAAEAALNAGEQWLLNLNATPSIIAGACQNFPCVQQQNNLNEYATNSKQWWNQNSASHTFPRSDVSASPRYLVEFLEFVPDGAVVGVSAQNSGVYYYRITAMGTGSNEDAISVLQSTVSRRF